MTSDLAWLPSGGKAEEVAAAIVFLCFERASFITGGFLRVDGGAVMTMGA